MKLAKLAGLAKEMEDNTFTSATPYPFSVQQNSVL